MRLITKQNFFAISCEIFTFLVIGKIIIEALFQQKFGNDQANIVVMLVLALAGTFILSQHYRLDRFPLLIMFLIQYVIIILVVLAIVWIGSLFEPVSEGGYFDMIISVSIPYVVLAVIYYISLYIENRKANQMLKNIKKSNG